VFEDFRRLASTTAPGKEGEKHEYTSEETALAERIKSDSTALNFEIDRILYASQILERISTFFLVRPSEPKVKKETNDFWYDIFNNVEARLGEVQQVVLRIEERANLVVGIFTSFILPILFGAIGAVAYVIRTISDQIKTSTFSHSSPIRHLMRVALGALSGVVVGLFVGLSSQLSLPPLALSFLAEYGVEAVFSMFDGIIDRFRQAKPI
jgi:hypothetical protein